MALNDTHYSHYPYIADVHLIHSEKSSPGLTMKSKSDIGLSPLARLLYSFWGALMDTVVMHDIIFDDSFQYVINWIISFSGYADGY
jgi:hypothetical protein